MAETQHTYLENEGYVINTDHH